MGNKTIRLQDTGTTTQDKEVFKDLDVVAHAVNYPFPKYRERIVLSHERDHNKIIRYDNANGDLPHETAVALYTASGDNYEQAVARNERKAKLKLLKLVNVKAVQNSIHNIFSWTRGERILNPEFGTRLRYLLYEGITTYNIEQIIAEINYSVQKWEPRANILSVVDISSIEETEDNTVHLRITYSIPTLTDEQFFYDYITQRSQD